MIRPKCPNCGHMLVTPVGPINSKVLLIGDFPGVEEMRVGSPFVGQVGDILRSELAREGIQLTACRATNIWQHDRNKECDFEWHVNEAMKEMKGRKFVLAMGSDVTNVLFNRNSMEISGLKIKHPVFEGCEIWCAPNPATVLYGPVGELRLAVHRFSERIRNA